MSILRSAFTVSSWNMVSRVSGFVREMVIAAKLGASGTSDAFFVALTLPNLLRRIFAEGAFNVAFVPILSRLMEEEGQEAAERFAAIALSAMSLVMLAITVIACWHMDYVIPLIAHGFVERQETFDTAILLGRITFPYLMLITIASLFGSVCNTMHRFWPYAFAPILLNLSFISCAFILPEVGISAEQALAYAMPIGGVAQVIFMYYAVRKSGFAIHATANVKHEKMKPLLQRMGPAALSVGILQISFIIDTQLASRLAENSVSYLQYASRFYQFPLSMIGVTMATVLLPHLSRSLRKADNKGANEAYSHSVLYGLALAFACSIGLFMLANPLFATFFERGAFTADTTNAAAWAMQAYCLGLPAFILTKITSTAFYANEDTRTPLIASCASLVVNFIFNIILMQYFAHVGIAMATAIAGWFNASVQLWLLKRAGFLHIDDAAKFKQQFLQVLVICSLMAVVLVGWDLAVPMGESTFLRLLWVAGASLIGAAVFVALSHKVKLFDVKEIINKILHRS